jgi:2-aminoadipate transaminase
MSYKVDLSDLDRSAGSLTAALVARFREAIDEGALAPAERLPTVRELAREAGVNSVTAARVYARLRELGYVTATVGRGTFVRDLPPFTADEVSEEWQSALLPAPPPSGGRERLLQDALRLARQGEVISLAVGLPARELLPVAEIEAATASVFAELGAEALAYTDVEGVPELREQLALLAREDGSAQGADEILVTSGGRQGIDLVCRALLRPGDVACVESPSFMGILASLEATGARLVGIPTDADGLDTGALERALARHPVKLVALQPACQNPTGRHLSAERRETLLRLARERGFLILEDAVYAPTTFAGVSPPSLRSAAPHHVVTVQSLSKSVGGGLRIGWLAASGPVFGRLVALKTTSDVNTAALPQRIAARYLATGAYRELLARAAPYYRQRAEALSAALARELGGELEVLEPLGGHSLWATFTRRIDEQGLYAEALRHGVTITPGAAARLEPSARAATRLSFSLAGPAELEQGARRLAAAYRSLLRAGRYAATRPAA